MPTNTIPLDQSGLSFSAIQSLKSLNINDAEVAEIVKAKQAGLSDDGCVRSFAWLILETKSFTRGTMSPNCLAPAWPNPR